MTGYQLPLSLTRLAVSREVLALHTAQPVSEMTDHSFLQESEASRTLLPTRSRMLPTAGMETGWQAGRSGGDCGLLRACAALKVTALEEEPSSCFQGES